MLIIKPILIWK